MEYEGILIGILLICQFIPLRTSRGAPIYRVEPESAPFDVAPLLGDLFPKNRLGPGRYSFRVVAIDSTGQVTEASEENHWNCFLKESECPVEVIVEGNSAPAPSSSSGMAFLDKDLAFGPKLMRTVGRRRRDRGNDLVLTLPENAPLGMLSQVPKNLEMLEIVSLSADFIACR